MNCSEENEAGEENREVGMRKATGRHHQVDNFGRSQGQLCG